MALFLGAVATVAMYPFEGTETYQVPAQYLLISLECQNGVFTQDSVDTIDLGNQNAFFEAVRVNPADVNNSGTESLADVIYLVNYLMRGGPPPLVDTFITDGLYFVLDSVGSGRMTYVKKLEGTEE